jgi:hypothetical protein
MPIFTDEIYFPHLLSSDRFRFTEGNNNLIYLAGYDLKQDFSLREQKLTKNFSLSRQ